MSAVKAPDRILRAASYGRQSKAREDESVGSPQAQQEATRAFIAARGWKFVNHFEDVGASGYDPKADRPGLDALLAAVERGDVDLLVVYRLDRLTRRGVVEAVRLVGFLADHGAALASVNEPFLDTSTPMGRGIFGIFAAMAEQESENISQRTRATKSVLSRAGSFSGGPRPFGFQPVKEIRDGLAVTVLRRDPEEAAVLAQVVANVLDGASISSEARRLNREGITTARQVGKDGAAKREGSEWSTSSLSRILKSPLLAGYQSSIRGGIVRDETGAPVAPWDAIVDPSDWHRLQDLISGRGGGRGPRETGTLLGGLDLFLCASCRGRMAGDRRGDGRGTYRCARHRRGSAACEGAAVAMAQTDEYLARLVWDRLRDLDPVNDADDLALARAVAARYADATADPEQEAAVRAAQAVLADAEAALLLLDDDRAAGVFDGPTGTDRYRRQVAALNDRADAARATLQALPRPSPGDDLEAVLDVVHALRYDGMDPLTDDDAPWPRWTLEERRDFLALFLHEVAVTKGEGHAGGNQAKWRGHERLAVTWVSEVPPPLPF
jgi:DNA invertase Pin-like site-specific DNA recombinase